MTRLPISEAPRDGSPILCRIDGEWLILRWYDRNAPEGWPDTVTYAPGWIDGSRDNSHSLNTQDRLNTFEPDHFYRLPEDEEDSVREDAWSEFECEHLTDGKGYATVEVYRRCRSAFDEAWPQGHVEAMRAALAALESRPVSKSSGER